jgi:hypothetical protein
VASSNDLLLEQLREIIDERQQDMRDGISPRALARRLAEMEVRERDRLEGVATGRYSIIGGISMPIPDPAHRRRSSRPPWLEKLITSKPVATAVAVILIAVASHMAARCGPLAIQPPPSMTK